MIAVQLICLRLVVSLSRRAIYYECELMSAGGLIADGAAAKANLSISGRGCDG